MKADVAVESYQYKAYDNKGNLVQGIERGGSEQAIIEKLRKQQLTPVSVNKVNLKKGGGRLTSAHIEEVTSQLALLLKSGLKIDKALQVLADNAANAKLQSVMSVVCQEVKQGRENCGEHYQSKRKCSILSTSKWYELVKTAVDYHKCLRSSPII